MLSPRAGAGRGRQEKSAVDTPKKGVHLGHARCSPLCEPRLSICEMGFLEPQGMDRQDQLYPFCHLQAAPKDPFLKAGPLWPTQAPSSQGNESRC